jgi:small conductance mechanosensitive channel
MNYFFEQLLKQTMDFIPRGGIGLVIFLFFWLIGAILQWIITTAGRKVHDDKGYVFRMAGTATKVTLVVLGALTALGTMGINVSALVAGLGLTGFALGFALRDILSNLMSGALIIIYRPFHHGDRISVAGCEGNVQEIDLRYTVVQGDNKTYLIPNSTLFTNTISVLSTDRGNNAAD